MRITGTDGAEPLSPRRVEAIVWMLAVTTFAYVCLSISLSPLLTAIAAEFAVSESAAGQLATIGGVVGTISALLSAPWMTRFPRRSWIRAELLVLMLATVISALAPSFAVMVLGRVLIGIGAGALLANCFTAASEVVSDPARRGRAVGIVASGTTTALLLGLPVIVFLEDRFGWRIALGSVLLPLTVTLLGTALLPAGRSAPSSGSERIAGATWARLRHDWTTLAIILASGLIFVTYIGWITYYSAYVDHAFPGSAGRIGVLFAVGGLAELVGNFAAPAMSHRFPVRLVALVGMAGMAAALLGSGVVFRSVAGLFVGIVILHLFTSFAYVGLNTLLVQRPEAIRGTVLALSSAAVGFGGALGALLGGLVLSWTDAYETVFHVLGLLLALGAVGFALVLRAEASGLEPARE